jgi:hypothetical protein
MAAAAPPKERGAASGNVNSGTPAEQSAPWCVARRSKESGMTTDHAVAAHGSAAAHLRIAADYSERAAGQYTHGAHEQAAHFALLAHAHMQHAGQFMSDAAKIHAELHGGNKHTLIG